MGKKLIIKGADFSKNAIYNDGSVSKTILYSSIDEEYSEYENYKVPFFTNRDILVAINNKEINYVKIKLSSLANTYLGKFVSVKKCNNTPILSIIASKELTQEDVNNGYIEIRFPKMIIESGYYLGIGDRDENSDPGMVSKTGYIAYKSSPNNLYIIGKGFVFKEFAGQIGIEIGLIR